MQQYKEIVSAPARVMLYQFLFLGFLVIVSIPVVFRLFFRLPESMQFADWPSMFINYLSHPPVIMLLPMLTVLACGIYFGNRITSYSR